MLQGDASTKYNMKLTPGTRRSTSGGAGDATISSPPSSQFSQSFRLRMAILDTLVNVCHYAKVRDDIVIEIAQATYFLLSSKQPSQQQQKTVELFSELIRANPDAMWLFLHQLNHTTFHPPSSSSGFASITLKAGSHVQPKDFQDNIKLLLPLCE